MEFITHDVVDNDRVDVKEDRIEIDGDVLISEDFNGKNMWSEIAKRETEEMYVDYHRGLYKSFDDYENEVSSGDFIYKGGAQYFVNNKGEFVEVKNPLATAAIRLMEAAFENFDDEDISRIEPGYHISNQSSDKGLTGGTARFEFEVDFSEDVFLRCPSVVKENDFNEIEVKQFDPTILVNKNKLNDSVEPNDKVNYSDGVEN